MNYWASHPLKAEQIKKRKLPDKYIQKIIGLAKDKTTSTMSSARITKYINLMLQRDKMNMTISKATVCRILKKEYGKPRKIKKVFYLNQKQKEQRLKFCQMILEKGIKGEQIFFTDETKIEMGSNINDHIRLSKENQQKLVEGDEDAYKLVNRPQKKFELSLIVAGGISSKGLSDLIFLEGPENEFSYAQILLYYKDNLDKFKGRIYFEQDCATPHTSAANKALIGKLFGEKAFLQNPPNSPDIAYPIETLWGYLKPRIKKRDPKNLKELKEIALEEWNLIPKGRIKNCGLNWIRRLKKIIEIGGGRLENCHLREIRREAKREENKTEIDELDNEEDELEEKQNNLSEDEFSTEKAEKELKIKYAYNDKRLRKLKKKEIANLRKKISEVKENFKNKEKNMEIKELKKLMANSGQAKNQKRKRKKEMKDKSGKEDKKKLREDKKLSIDEINNKIQEIEKMNITEYLKHLRGKNVKRAKKEIIKEEDDDTSTIDEAIIKIKRIKKLENKEIKYDLEF